MTTTTVEPAIWIADLAAYNSGISHGRWVKVTEDTIIEDLQAAVNEILEEGQRRYGDETLSQHEEFAIHDFEGFGPLKINEYASLQAVLEYAQHINEHGDKFFAFIDAIGQHDVDQFDTYEVFGPYDDLDEYAWNDLEELVLGPNLISYRSEAVLEYALQDWLTKQGMPSILASAFRFDTEEYIEQVRNAGVSFGWSNGKVYAIEPR